MAWCIWVYLVLVFIRTCAIAGMHGKKMDGTYNIGWTLFTSALFLSLLYFGGAFHTIGLN